jgi:dCTP deaminase
MVRMETERLARTFDGSGSGILPDRSILKLTEAGFIRPSAAYADGQVQPASLDLRLGAVAYRVRASFLPGSQATVAERIDALRLHSIDLTGGAVLETGCVYIVPLMESLSLPADGLRHCQSEKFDRPARCVHPRDRRSARAASIRLRPRL